MDNQITSYFFNFFENFEFLKNPRNPSHLLFLSLVIKKEKFHDSLTHEQLSKFAKVILSNGEKYDVEMYLVECEDEEGD